MLYFLILLYLSLFSYLFGMEMIELEAILKNKKIKTVDEACVVASFSSENWTDYTLSSNVIVDIITQKEECTDQLNKTIKQQIKNLKKEPNKFIQLTHEIFTELSSANFPNILKKMRTVRNEADLYYLIQQERDLQVLQEGLSYYEKKEERWNQFRRSSNMVVLSFLITVSTVCNIMALVYTGAFSQYCW